MQSQKNLWARVLATWRRRRGVFAPVILLLLSTGCSASQSALAPKGPAARSIATLWWVMFAVAAVVFVVVLFLLILALARRNADRSGRLGDGRRLVVWAGIVAPAVILSAVMGLAIYSTGTIAAPATASSLTIEVIGHQWWWEIRYPDLGVTTANEIHIPTGQPVKLRVSTADVIHSVWIPELQGKIDTIPGQINDTWIQADAPGTYRGQCGEYCGAQHARMAMLVIATGADQFQAWAQGQSMPAQPVGSARAREGQQVFLGSACVYCHRVAGTNATGAVGPDLTHLASRQTIGAGLLENNRGNLAGWIVNSQALKPGNRMPPMYLGGEDLQALLDYLGSLN